MDAGKELIQRMLDGELDEAKERELERLVLQDPALARDLDRALALRRLLAELKEVRDPGPALTDRIMAALPPSPRSRWSWQVLLRPAPVPAWALALALLLCGLAGALVGQRLWPGSGQVPATAAHGSQGPAGPAVAGPVSPRPVARPGRPACDPDLLCPAPRVQTVLVRFHLAAPRARSVSLMGDFNGWSETSTPLSDPDGNGTWTVTVPLEPGRYQYRFMVNGKQWVLDPESAMHLPDGFGGMNSVVSL